MLLNASRDPSCTKRSFFNTSMARTSRIEILDIACWQFRDGNWLRNL